MSKKRQRDPATIDTQLVEIYDDLANESEDIRLKAAHSLLSKVSPEDTPTKERLLEILTRLIRGLCSPRKAARLGFSVALTEFLVQTQGKPEKDLPAQLDVQEVIEILKKQTVAGGNVSGNELKNHDLGRLFGAEAIIKSGVPFHPGVSTDAWSQILDIILELGKKKSWLRKECGWVLYKAIQTLGKQEVHVQRVLDKICEHGLAKTPEGVAIWLGAQSTESQVRFPEGVWHKDDPLHRNEKSMLAHILREAPSTKPGRRDGIDNFNQTGNWSPDLHFAWDVVIANLLKEQRFDDLKHKEKARRLAFQEFWNEAVDDSLFSASSSDQRKYWGFILFQRLLLSAPVGVLPAIFSERLMRCLVNQLASPERYLHRVAEKTIKFVFTRVNQEPSATITILNGLSRPPSGPINFDQITKTKTVEKLLAHIEDRSLVDLLPFFSQLIAKPSKQDEKATITSRRMAADQLVSIVRSKQTIAGTETTRSSESVVFVDQVLSLFAKHAYFVHEQRASTPRAAIDPPISETSREMFKSRISSCLNHILATCAEPALFSYDLVAWIHSMDKAENDLKFLFKSEDAVKKTIDKAWVTMEKIHLKSMSAQGSRKRLLSAFDLLYSLTLLQVYSGEAEAVGILDELKSSYDDLLKHKQKSEQGSSDALIEILLSFVSKPSSLFRRLARQVFSACTSDVSSHGLQSMIKVLETKESLAGQDEIFDQEDDEHQEESDDDDVSDASDVSMAEAGPNDADEDSAEDSSAESSDDGPDEELAAFDAKLATALGTRSATDDLAANDSEHSSSADMNDEQMEALDAHLEKVFRERKNLDNQKTQNKNAREAITNFKSRVLELLGIYIKQQHSKPLALDLLIPLLNLIRTTKSPIVSNKACDLIQDYAKLCKPTSVPSPPDSNATIQLLQEIHQQARKEGSKAYNSACSRASLLLVKALAADGREHLGAVVAIYAESHRRFMLDPKGSHVKASFFADWLNWSVTARNTLLHTS